MPSERCIQINSRFLKFAAQTSSNLACEVYLAIPAASKMRNVNVSSPSFPFERDRARKTFYVALPTWDGQFCLLFLACAAARRGRARPQRGPRGRSERGERARANERRHEDLWPELRRVSRIFLAPSARDGERGQRGKGKEGCLVWTRLGA